MKTIKLLPLTLLFAASYTCAMELSQSKYIAPVIEYVQYMDKHGTAEDARLKLAFNEIYNEYSPYLHVAIAARAHNALTLFLDAGAPIEIDRRGITPLNYAFEKKNYEAVDILCKYSHARKYNLQDIIDRNDHQGLQKVIDNNLLPFPDIIIDCTKGLSKELASTCKSLALVLSCTSDSSLTMPTGLYQKTCEYLCEYYRTAFFHCRESNYIAKQSDLENFIIKHAASIRASNDTTWRTYAVAVNKEGRGGGAVLKALQKHVAINPTEAWKSIPSQISQASTNENNNALLAQVYTVLTLLQPFIDEQTANAIDDVVKQSPPYAMSPYLQNLLYDYTSADRHTLRSVNPLYWYRRCTKAAVVANDASIAAVSETTTQSGQIDAASDNTCAHDDQNENEKKKQ